MQKDSDPPGTDSVTAFFAAARAAAFRLHQRLRAADILCKFQMDSLNPIEKEVYDYLRRTPLVYISASEVSKNVGNRKWFNADKNWARPVLRRLEMDGVLESNPFGEYRVKARPTSETSF